MARLVGGGGGCSQENDGANILVKWTTLHPFKGMFQKYIPSLNFEAKS